MKNHIIVPIIYIIGIATGFAMIHNGAQTDTMKLSKEISDKIAECEAQLPRNYHCEIVLTAQPIVGESK